MVDRTTGEVTLLSGGNPQIPKGDGDAPVQAYIAAMPGWKQDVGRSLDALVREVVPGLRTAVRWNQPYYGAGGEGWFLSFRCYNEYVQVQFFRGTSLDPMPPKGSKHPEVRYLNIRQGDDVATDELRSWIGQAAALPGERF